MTGPGQIAASGNALAINMEGVSKWYGNVVAVNDVSFEIGPGITGLLGPNGAGKSTILHMMGGLLRASAGAVSVVGEPAAGNPEVYRKVGIVLEREAIYGTLTGWNFVRMNARLHGLADVDAATRRAIERVDMGYAQGRATGGYSKGMKQRIKIAAAIVSVLISILYRFTADNSSERDAIEFASGILATFVVPIVLPLAALLVGTSPVRQDIEAGSPTCWRSRSRGGRWSSRRCIRRGC